jgi:hypothetical protein
MRYFACCATLVFLSLLQPSVHATPLDDKIAALKTAIKDEVAGNLSKAPDAPLSAAYSNTGYLIASFDQIPAQMDSPNTVNNIDVQLSQVLANYHSPEAQKAGLDLRAEVQRERQARVDAAVAHGQALLKKASAAVTGAKKTEDIDETLSDLQKFLIQRNGYNAVDQTLYQQVSSGFDFARAWQEYLAHLAHDESELAQTALQQINQTNSEVGLLPRSVVLDRLNILSASISAKNTAAANAENSEVASILSNVKTLDDLRPAVQKLSALSHSDSGVAHKAYMTLVPLARLYESAKEGLPQVLNLNFASDSGELGIRPQIQAQLLVFVLRHYFDSYKGPTPAGDEKPQDFVNQVIADAVARQDWPLLRKALNGQAYLNRNSSLGVYATNTISSSVESLLAGLNQEEAGQFAMAVMSYQTALKASDTTTTAKLIGDKLEAIRKDHPNEYEEGKQIFISLQNGRNSYSPSSLNGSFRRPALPGPISASLPIPNPGPATNQPTATPPK